jgi:hypothetical protein
MRATHNLPCLPRRDCLMPTGGTLPSINTLLTASQTDEILA